MLDSQPGQRSMQEHQPPHDHDNGHGQISGNLEWPSKEQDPIPQPDSVPNFSTDTSRVQHPIAERQPQLGTERKWRKFLTLGSVGVATVGAIASAVFVGKGGDAAPSAGTNNTATETSASPTPGSESTAPSADVVTPEPYADPNLEVKMPVRLEDREVKEEFDFELGKEGYGSREIASILGDSMSSELTYGDFFEDNFEGTFKGGEWVKPEKDSVPGGSTLDTERRKTLKNTDDGGLAFRTHFAMIGDQVKACEAINGGRPCGFNVSITSEAETTPMYLKMEDENGATQEVRIRQTLPGQEATVRVIGFDMKTMKPLTDTELHLPLADIYYVGPDGKGQTRFVAPPV